MSRVNNKDFYLSAINKHGITAKGLNWNSKETQEIRFDVILEMLPQDLSEFCITDAGCGFADFYLYMQGKSKTPKKYIGIDNLDKMCEISLTNSNSKIINADVCKDTLPTCDYYICSGALNTLNKFETYQFIQNCYSTCSKGFIFNILYGNKLSKTYNYFNLREIKQLAKELHVQDMKIKKDYLEDDITVAFLKEAT